MTDREFRGIFICEGSSDLPLAEIVESLFFERDTRVSLSKPDFERLGKVSKDVTSRVRAALRLHASRPDLVVIHRDADNAGNEARRLEILRCADAGGAQGGVVVVPVIPVRMTEAWLLLDERLIRRVAGNPNGRAPLRLPKPHEAEKVADPKQLLRGCLMDAAEVGKRRRDRARDRFPEHRRQLLERLDCGGPVRGLASWRRLVSDIEGVVEFWRGGPRAG